MAGRGLSLLVQPDQWARCAHDGTALLPDGGVELSWLDPAVSAAGCVELPAHSGLAFDRWCRSYRSRPETGRIEVSQRDVSQGGSHLAGQIELRRIIAKAHAARAIEQEIDVQVLLFLKPLEEQIAMPGVDVPVEISQVIASRVFPVVSELNA